VPEPMRSIEMPSGPLIAWLACMVCIACSSCDVSPGIIRTPGIGAGRRALSARAESGRGGGCWCCAGSREAVRSAATAAPHGTAVKRKLLNENIRDPKWRPRRGPRTGRASRRPHAARSGRGNLRTRVVCGLRLRRGWLRLERPGRRRLVRAHPHAGNQVRQIA
jgi:hypothetical protein